MKSMRMMKRKRLTNLDAGDDDDDDAATAAAEDDVADWKMGLSWMKKKTLSRKCVRMGAREAAV